MLEKVKILLGSRKFFAALIAFILTFINSNIKIVDDSAMATIVGAISAWIIGQAIVDANTVKNLPS